MLVRVGREPNRKLSNTDRLVGPMLNAYSYGFAVDNLIKGIAAGLRFDYEGDPQSQILQEKIRTMGLRAAAAEITGITDEALLDRIVKAYDTIADEVM